MAEQFPEKGGKIPASKTPSRRGLSGHSPAWAPQKCKGARPLPLPTPDRTGVVGVLCFPPPQGQENIPWHPYSHQSPALFPFRYPCLPPHRSWGSSPSRSPPPLPHSGFHLPPGTLSVHSCHGRCHSASPCPQPWPESCGTGGASEGTAGRQLPLRHTRCPWAAGGGGEVFVGTLRSRRRASSSAVPRLTAGGRGPSCCRSSPRPGAGVTLGEGVRAARLDSSPGLGPETAPGAAARPARRCGAPQTARRAALTWAGRLRVPVHGPLVAGSLRAL